METSSPYTITTSNDSYKNNTTSFKSIILKNSHRLRQKSATNLFKKEEPEIETAKPENLKLSSRLYRYRPKHYTTPGKSSTNISNKIENSTFFNESKDKVIKVTKQLFFSRTKNDFYKSNELYKENTFEEKKKKNNIINSINNISIIPSIRRQTYNYSDKVTTSTAECDDNANNNNLPQKKTKVDYFPITFSRRKYKSNTNNLETIKVNKKSELLYNNNNLQKKNDLNKFITSNNVKKLWKNEVSNNTSIDKNQTTTGKRFLEKRSLGNIFSIIRNKSSSCFRLTEEDKKTQMKNNDEKKTENIVNNRVSKYNNRDDKYMYSRNKQNNQNNKYNRMTNDNKNNKISNNENEQSPVKNKSGVRYIYRYSRNKENIDTKAKEIIAKNNKSSDITNKEIYNNKNYITKTDEKNNDAAIANRTRSSIRRALKEKNQAIETNTKKDDENEENKNKNKHSYYSCSVKYRSKNIIKNNNNNNNNNNDDKNNISNNNNNNSNNNISNNNISENKTPNNLSSSNYLRNRYRRYCRNTTDTNSPNKRYRITKCLEETVDEKLDPFITHFFEDLINITENGFESKDTFSFLINEINRKYITCFNNKKFEITDENFVYCFKYFCVILIVLIFFSKDENLYKKNLGKTKENIINYTYSALCYIGYNKISLLKINNFIKNYDSRKKISMVECTLTIISTNLDDFKEYSVVKKITNQLMKNLVKENITNILLILNNCVLYCSNTGVNSIFPLQNPKLTFCFNFNSELFRKEDKHTLPSTPFIKQRMKKKFCLILDIDETITYSIKLKIGYYFLIRPGVIEFLQEISKYFEIIFFTSSYKNYADFILDKIDSRGFIISHRLYRSHVSFENGRSVKKLNLIGRDLKKIIFVDNLRYNAKYNPENLYLIPSWFGDIYDKEIEKLKDKLLYLVNSGKYNDDITQGLNGK